MTKRGGYRNPGEIVRANEMCPTKFSFGHLYLSQTHFLCGAASSAKDACCLCMSQVLYTTNEILFVLMMSFTYQRVGFGTPLLNSTAIHGNQIT
ncbi:MAG: hypothetical protein EZS28_029376 [Streblomastix strix]|uniref:Uncharacterized protein n=1 Tax=Streblomastix strix TaxID=222440 RepID=A0A5J4UXN1_9EUKA|nr:MAG: hypothetical protein EZS28_029376 [Streblomastix strix]